MADVVRARAARRRRSHLGLIAAGLVLLGTPAFAQGADCPPPKKAAAGACVAACPGGYEDRGRVCVYRNQSR